MAFCSNLIRFRHISRSQIEFGLNLPEHGDSRRLVQGKPVRSNAFLSSSWRYQGDTYYLLSPDSPPTCIYYPVNSSRRFLFLLANHGSLSFPFRRYAVLVGRSQILLPIYGRVFKSSVQNYPLRKKMSPSKTIFWTDFWPPAINDDHIEGIGVRWWGASQGSDPLLEANRLVESHRSRRYLSGFCRSSTRFLRSPQIFFFFVDLSSFRMFPSPDLYARHKTMGRQKRRHSQRITVTIRTQRLQHRMKISISRCHFQWKSHWPASWFACWGQIPR